MNRLWRLALTVCAVLLVLGIAVAGVGLLTGGSYERIIHTTDIADMTKFFTYEEIDRFVSLFFK